MEFKSDIWPILMNKLNKWKKPLINGMKRGDEMGG